MRIFKKFTDKYTTMDNRVAQLSDLDLNAKGLYWYIATKPDGWCFNMERIARDNNTTLGKVQKAIRDLEAVGLLEREYAQFTIKENGERTRGKMANYIVYDFDTIQENTSLKKSSPKKLSLDFVGDIINNKDNKIMNLKNNESINSDFENFENSQIKSKEKENNDFNLDLAFNSFWSEYPNKKAKANAEKCFLRAFKGKKDKKAHFDLIMSGLAKYNAHIKSAGIDSRFIKHPSTWLNQECWNDEYAPSQSNRLVATKENDDGRYTHNPDFGYEEAKKLLGRRDGANNPNFGYNDAKKLLGGKNNE